LAEIARRPCILRSHRSKCRGLPHAQRVADRRESGSGSGRSGSFSWALLCVYRTQTNNHCDYLASVR
ncbi:MAG: hypothetical protein AAB972_00405, partial [Patescibacteria group bacterium]